MPLLVRALGAHQLLMLDTYQLTFIGLDAGARLNSATSVACGGRTVIVTWRTKVEWSSAQRKSSIVTKTRSSLKLNAIVVCVSSMLIYKRTMSATTLAGFSVCLGVEGDDSNARCAMHGIGSTSCNVAIATSMFARTAGETASNVHQTQSSPLHPFLSSIEKEACLNLRFFTICYPNLKDTLSF